MFRDDFKNRYTTIPFAIYRAYYEHERIAAISHQHKEIELISVKTGSADFIEFIGIILAILVSVCITLIMEGSSQKAFDALSKMYDKIFVKVLRDGKVTTIPQEEVVVGDVVELTAGDKIVADGRLIECVEFSVDESALTGESVPSKKDAKVVLAVGSHLAERKNMVYSGSFVTG